MFTENYLLLTVKMDKTNTETLPLVSPIYISELLSFQHKQLIESELCSIIVVIGFAVDFRALRQTFPRIVTNATVFSSGDIRIKVTAPS